MSKKKVDIVSIHLVREKSILWEYRKINNPTDAYNLLRDFLSDIDREKFIVVCLNTKNEPVNINTVSVGSINSTLVKPMDVMKTAILSNCNKILLAHNHPSGDPSPSKDDLAMTERIRNAGKILGIEIVDHIIIAGKKYYSFLEKQLMFEKSGK